MYVKVDPLVGLLSNWDVGQRAFVEVVENVIRIWVGRTYRVRHQCVDHLTGHHHRGHYHLELLRSVSSYHRYRLCRVHLRCFGLHHNRRWLLRRCGQSFHLYKMRMISHCNCLEARFLSRIFGYCRWRCERLELTSVVRTQATTSAAAGTVIVAVPTSSCATSAS